MKLTREANRHDPLIAACLFTLPLGTYFVHSPATWCAIALIALGYISGGRA